MEGMSNFEPLEHSVLNAARGNCSRMEVSVCEPLEHSVRMMTLDDSPVEKMSDDEPLEHSVLDAAMTCRRVVGAPVRPPLQCSIMTMGLARGLRTEGWGTAVWSRPRTDIVGWSPRYGDHLPDIGLASSASDREWWPSSLIVSRWTASD